MSLKKVTPCDFGVCPYETDSYCSCEYWCGADEPADDPDDWEPVLGEDSMGYADFRDDEDDCDYEVGYDPYMGCYSDEC